MINVVTLTPTFTPTAVPYGSVTPTPRGTKIVVVARVDTFLCECDCPTATPVPTATTDPALLARAVLASATMSTATPVSYPTPTSIAEPDTVAIARGETARGVRFGVGAGIVALLFALGLLSLRRRSR